METAIFHRHGAANEQQGAAKNTARNSQQSIGVLARIPALTYRGTIAPFERRIPARARH
jgi:hypothetical protein